MAKRKTEDSVKRHFLVYATEVLVSLLVVGGLFWAAFFVTPTVKVEKIERFPFERRDAFYSVAVLDPQGESVCLVGSYGKIVRTDDGGSTWAIQPSPSLAHLQKVVAWDRESLLAVGDQGTVLATRDAGKSWERLDLPADAAVDQLLSAQIEPENGRVWVVGRNGAVLASEDRGASWRTAHPAEDVSWNDIAVVDGRIWIAGEFGKVQTSRDDGQSWQEVAVPTESSLNAIAFADAAHGVIVGLSGTILVTADGGRSWQQAASGVETHLYDVLWDGITYRAVGDAGMVVTADARGAPWQADKLSPDNFGWYTGIAPAGGSYFVCGAGVGCYTDKRWRSFEPGCASYEKPTTGGANG